MRIVLGILCLCGAIGIILSQIVELVEIEYIEDDEEENK